MAGEQIIVCDLDGTLCDVEHRRHFVERPHGVRKDWDAFFAGALDDKVIKPVLDLLYMVSEYSTVIFCTGRPERCRADTVAWLEKHAFPFSQCELYMRKHGDFRPDDIVKQEILDTHIDKDRVLFVLDDRDQVVNMWRRNGLACFQVADGNF